ncbi:type III secretion system inner rod subunit SctI [Lampropedia aestuarii]|uniref:type III secretion system inner rod subunit SctI n=1 Tax=Lampropedia aestuarii TaxID=2562762 RepID=UPI0024688A09|nr:type III secretion system inner rod subunit SctI [Lampropedia aestuarii]MDH5857333.1 type III secretion system inner rod subunit SctI [Lampropedia aestuarii]
MEILSSAMMGVVTPSSAPAQTKVKLDEVAATRFAALMQAPSGADNAAAVNATSEVASTTSTTPATWGDRILSGMQGVSSDFHGQWDSVRQALASPRAIEPREMLQLQMQMHHMSIQSELVGKLVSRSTQNIDQLVRLQ